MSPSNTCGKTQRKPGDLRSLCGACRSDAILSSLLLVYLPRCPLRGRLTPSLPGYSVAATLNSRARRGLSSSGLLSTSASAPPPVLCNTSQSSSVSFQGLSLTPKVLETLAFFSQRPYILHLRRWLGLVQGPVAGQLTPLHSLPDPHLQGSSCAAEGDPLKAWLSSEARDPYTSPKKVAENGWVSSLGGRTAKASCMALPPPPLS